MSDKLRILVIGYRKFSELVNTLLPEFADEADITIVESVASGATDYSQLVQRYQPDAIASAGSNAAYLQATLTVPVIAQPVSDTDVIEALVKARRIASRVHVFTYADDASLVTRLMDSLPELMGMEIVPVSYRTTVEATESLLLALADQRPEVVVGPSYICHMAEQRGSPAILVYSRPSARAMLRRAIDAARAGQSLSSSPGPATGERFVIHSPQMSRVAELARTYARGSAAVLLEGESGTGKEHIAREIHRLGSYCAGPMVAVNCGSIPNELFESELFGYVEGAFTSSRRGGRVGLIEQANGGVLFLDEIGEMPGPQQVKLLRALQERRIRPVGSNREIALDFKVIAATNRDLRDAVARGEFRDDLFFRLNVFALKIPPLRERPDDILAIARHYLELYASQYGVSLDTQAMLELVSEQFARYAWPGNVRELQNFVERLVVNSLDWNLADLDPQVLDDILPELAAAGAERGALREQEEAAIREAMLRFGQNKQRVADFLGISATTLWRRLKQMEWQPPSRGSTATDGK